MVGNFVGRYFSEILQTVKAIAKFNIFFNGGMLVIDIKSSGEFRMVLYKYLKPKDEVQEITSKLQKTLYQGESNEEMALE